MPIRAIYKYSLPTDAIVSSGGKFTLFLPIGAIILKVAVQNKIPVIWAIVDPTQRENREERMFFLAITGQKIETTNLEYIGTIQTKTKTYHGNYFLHLFEDLSR